jgi:hypothetical protein
MSARLTLDEPVVISKFWRTRHRNEIVQIELSTYEGHNLISVRVFRTGADGIDRPTTKGLALSVGKLKELARALANAEAKARELGLLPPDGEGGE